MNAEKPRLGRRFWFVAASQALSGVGSVVSSFAVAVHVYTTTGSITALGLLSFVGTASAVAISPFLKIVDRFDRRTIMLLADTVAVVPVVLAILWALLANVPLAALVILTIIVAGSDAFRQSAFNACVPDLVDEEALARANGVLQLGGGLRVLLGPILATTFLGLGGLTLVFLADFVTFVFAIAVVLSFRFGLTPSVTETPKWREALTWVRRESIVARRSISFGAAINVVFGAYNVLVVAVGVAVVGLDGVGVIVSAGGVAMLTSAAVIGHFGLGDRLWRSFELGSVLAGLGLFLSMIWPNSFSVVAGSAVALAAVPLAGAALATMLHKTVAPEMLGRVFGLRATAGQVAQSLGNLLLGPLLVLGFTEIGPTAQRNSPGKLFGSQEFVGSFMAMAALGILLVATGCTSYIVRRRGGPDLATDPEAAAKAAA